MKLTLCASAYFISEMTDWNQMKFGDCVRNFIVPRVVTNWNSVWTS